MGQEWWRYLLVALRSRQTGLVPFFYINVAGRRAEKGGPGRKGTARGKRKTGDREMSERVQDWPGEGGLRAGSLVDDVKYMHPHTYTHIDAPQATRACIHT